MRLDFVGTAPASRMPSSTEIFNHSIIEKVKPGDVLFCNFLNSHKHFFPPWNELLIHDHNLISNPTPKNIFLAGLRAPLAKLFDSGVSLYGHIIRYTMGLYSDYKKHDDLIPMDDFDPDIGHCSLVLDVDHTHNTLMIAEGMPYHGVRIVTLTPEDIPNTYEKVKILTPNNDHIRKHQAKFVEQVRSILRLSTRTPYPTYPSELGVFFKLVTEPLYKKEDASSSSQRYAKYVKSLNEQTLFLNSSGKPEPLFCSAWVSALIGGQYHTLGLDGHWTPKNPNRIAPSHLESLLKKDSNWSTSLNLSHKV